MPDIPIRRALLSVYDKTGLVEFARALHDEFGIALISTGGTAKVLRDAGLPVTLVEEVTGFPEMMDGRVKTLHPKIHAAILADRDNPEHMRQLAEQGIEPIDMVVVNLYPFEKTIADPNCTFEQAIEMIDIGGPCLLRAAAKNHKHVLVLSNPCHYRRTLRFLRHDAKAPGPEWPLWLVTKAFQQTAPYDIAIHKYFAELYWKSPFTPYILLQLGLSTPTPSNELRYGENPHQRASLYRLPHERDGIVTSPLDGMEELLSFNNYADASAALELCAELTRAGSERSAVCFIKHTNTCGTAVHADSVEAYRRAYLGDPNAAMGGVLAVNFPVTADFAEVVLDTYQRFGRPLKDAGAANAPGGFFVEVWIAPEFQKDAVRVIRGEVDGKPKKDWGQRVRLLAVGDMGAEPFADELDFKHIAGGMLVQTRDLVGLNEEQWQVVTQRSPTPQEMEDLRLAWLVCKHTKSNAISICKDGMLLGNGAGQMSRVMSCRIATWLAKDNGHDLTGAVAASDAFFPFADGPAVLLDAGATALIQPGGSKRDADTVALCNERGAAMIFTGTRHFKH